MIVSYKAEFQESSFTETLPDGNSDTRPLNVDEISELEKVCRDYKWNRSIELSQQIGKRLFDLLNDDRQTLIKALTEAEAQGNKLQLILKGEGSASTLPFELLYHNGFLVTSQIHLIRRVSERGKKSKPGPENRPLRLLLMACSPLDVYPLLEFEKEEDTIYEVTKDLPMEIDVEDSGSLEGLGDRLATNKYDVVHITGHADIDKNGEPFFWMEDDEGLPVQVTPSQLWEKLDLNLPRMVFLSGCRTGEAPEHVAAMSFAHHLVKGNIPAVLGWGLPVSDMGASFTSQELYFELSRGENILDAILRTRRKLYEQFPDWSILRLFSDGTALDVPLVTSGLKRRPKPRALQYIFLENSQVKVLKKGFIGRRRHLQQGIKCLRRDTEKVGLLLHGTGGLGKSCLAGKFCDRFKDHGLIIVHGVLNAFTFLEALEHSFRRWKDDEGLEITEENEEMSDKIERLCYSAFQKGNYLILLDDFEQNLLGIEEGRPKVCPEAVPILESLLRFLPYTDKMTHLIITSRYTFYLTLGGKDLISERLEPIGLTSFRDADENKKVSELDNIANYPDPEIRKKLITAGHGNPRLMEALDTLIEVKGKGIDLTLLPTLIKEKKEEFVQGLILNQIIQSQPKEFHIFLSRSAVFRLPILKEGIESVCCDMKDWESHIEKAVRFSLMEEDKTHQEYRYWVTPLIREKIFGELREEERKKCHQTAVSYYQSVLSEEYITVLSVELIDHAVKGELLEIAVEEGGRRLLPYLHKSLAYREALVYGNYILANISELRKDDKFSEFIFELGKLHSDTGNPRQAIEYFEQALSIEKEVYGGGHLAVVPLLSNIGVEWNALGDYKKAREYFEQVLSICKEYGERNPLMASAISNIGAAWRELGDYKKAIEHFEQALSICKEYGERNHHVATILNNIGTVWRELGDYEKAIEYYEKSLSIDKEVFGERHPYVATKFNNIGSALIEVGDSRRAIEYCKQALSIDKEVFGERHPHVASTLNNIGLAWKELGDFKKAIEYYEKSLSIDKEMFGERHPHVASTLNNIGLAWKELGDFKKAIEYYEQTLSLDKEIYGERHPYIASTFNNIGLAWNALGYYKKAIKYFEKALSIYKKVYGERHSYVAFTLINIGLAWGELGDYKKAIENSKLVYDILGLDY